MLPTMPAAKTHTPTIAIVGAGNLGSALALSLSATGCLITEIVSRDVKTPRQRSRTLARRVGARATTIADAELSANLVWFCVPDSAIAGCARSLSHLHWTGKVAWHSSGALTSRELGPLKKRGARIASVHPMMTFVAGVTPSLQGVPFAVEGDRRAVSTARKIVARLGGHSFLIAGKDKALYHAWGTFASPLLTTLLALTERIGEKAGVPREKTRPWVLPIVRQTVENYARHGAARGFSGPTVRGDVSTLKKHLKELRRLPGAKETYLALARFAAQNLPAKNKAKLLRVLK